MDNTETKSAGTTDAGIIIRYGDTPRIIPIRELLEMLSIRKLLETLGMDANELPTELSIFVSKNGNTLLATCNPCEQDYASITTDGFDSNQNRLWLTQTELPNEAYLHSISARLYAGYAKYEADSPIALTIHDVKDREKLRQRISDPKHTYTKIVHVDTGIAQYRPWRAAYELPEHAED